MILFFSVLLNFSSFSLYYLEMTLILGSYLILAQVTRLDKNTAPEMKNEVLADLQRKSGQQQATDAATVGISIENHLLPPLARNGYMSAQMFRCKYLHLFLLEHFAIQDDNSTSGLKLLRFKNEDVIEALPLDLFLRVIGTPAKLYHGTISKLASVKLKDLDNSLRRNLDGGKMIGVYCISVRCLLLMACACALCWYHCWCSMLIF